MTEEAKSNANGANARRRPVPLLGPVAGMRAMAEVQAEGLRAASGLFERALGPDQEDRTARPPSQSPSSAPVGL